jgi:hypothetical protein
MRVRARTTTATTTSITTIISSRAHDNKQDQSLGYGFSYIEIQSWLQVLHLFLCFHNSNGVLETIAQRVRIEGGLCEFACAQQQDQSFGFGFST